MKLEPTTGSLPREPALSSSMARSYLSLSLSSLKGFAVQMPKSQAQRRGSNSTRRCPCHHEGAPQPGPAPHWPSSQSETRVTAQRSPRDAVEEGGVILSGIWFPPLESHARGRRPPKRGLQAPLPEKVPRWASPTRLRRRQPILRVPFRIGRLRQSPLYLPSLSGARLCRLPVTWLEARRGFQCGRGREGGRAPPPGGEGPSAGRLCPAGLRGSLRVSSAGAAPGVGLGSDLGGQRGPRSLTPGPCACSPRCCKRAHLHPRGPTQNAPRTPCRNRSALRTSGAL